MTMDSGANVISSNGSDRFPRCGPVRSAHRAQVTATTCPERVELRTCNSATPTRTSWWRVRIPCVMATCVHRSIDHVKPLRVRWSGKVDIGWIQREAAWRASYAPANSSPESSIVRAPHFARSSSSVAATHTARLLRIQRRRPTKCFAQLLRGDVFRI